MGIKHESYCPQLLLSQVYYTIQRFNPAEITGGEWCLDAVFDPIGVWLIISAIVTQKG